MRGINDNLFQRLKKRSTHFATAWLVTRVDGQQFGFTSHDREFVYDGVTYYPENGIAHDAVQTKHDFSTNNSSAKILFSEHISEHDVRAGLFDYADVRSFWLDPYDLAHGIIPIQRGFIGEIRMINNEWTAEFRSILDRLQMPFGNQYNLECSAKLGDSRCGVAVNPPVWTPNTTLVAHVGGDARIGAVIKPSVYTGFWYQCVNGTHTTQLNFDRGVSYAGLGPDPYAGSGFNPFDSLGWMGFLFAQLFEAQLASYNPPGAANIVSITVHGGKTGATEPTWPTVADATVTDGELTWKAIPARIRPGTATGVKSRAQFVDTNRTEENQTYQYGWLKWTSGENAGKVVEVRAQNDGLITLLEVMPFQIKQGDTYEISVGCGKTRAACKNKFDNLLNFRGFPDMPTEDRALATPNFSTNNSDFSSWTDGGGGGKK